MLRNKLNKQAQESGGGSAAVFVAIVAFMIILYILFLPPEDRAEILGEGSSTTSSSGIVSSSGSGSESDEISVSDKNVLLLVNPGLLSVQGDDAIHHFIPRVRLYEQSSGTVLDEHGAITVKKSIFDSQPKSWEIALEDPKNTKNILIDFVVTKGEGDLLVKFNGQEVFEGAVSGGNIAPISIENELLKKNNAIEFSVSSPGFMFWKTNQYYIDKIKAVATLYDSSHLSTKNTFYISEDEFKDADKISMKYYPACDSKKIGPLTIKVNTDSVYSGTPVCNIENQIEFGPERVRQGDNELVFSTTYGEYEINRIDLKADVEEKEDYVYYFDMDRKFFEEDDEEQCGAVDDVCPDGCNADNDVDCCFEDSEDNYWCDYETDDAGDRCVSAVDTAKCLWCPTLYEDEDGEPAKACEKMCGDDTDNVCPAGCSKYGDKDCCYAESANNYWCDDVPVTGLSSVCEASITSGECNDCPNEYEQKNGNTPDNCGAVEGSTRKLNPGYAVKLDFKFLDDDKEKEFELSVNGRKTIIKTKEDSQAEDISSKVVQDYNSIKIKPTKSFEINEIKVTLKD